MIEKHSGSVHCLAQCGGNLLMIKFPLAWVTDVVTVWMVTVSEVVSWGMCWQKPCTTFWIERNQRVFQHKASARDLGFLWQKNNKLYWGFLEFRKGVSSNLKWIELCVIAGVFLQKFEIHPADGEEFGWIVFVWYWFFVNCNFLVFAPIWWDYFDAFV